MPEMMEKQENRLRKTFIGRHRRVLIILAILCISLFSVTISLSKEGLTIQERVGDFIKGFTSFAYPDGIIGSDRDAPVGYQLYNDTVEIWNPEDTYYFDRSSGIQFTNHFEDFWTKNIFCVGYYDGDDWNKIKCADELSDFSRSIHSDNETYVNATLWKDFSYSDYDLRLGVNYYLDLDDTSLSIIVYSKNIGMDIPFDLGFVWKTTEFDIPPEVSGDSIIINNTLYNLDDAFDLTFKNITRVYPHPDTEEIIVEYLPFFRANDNVEYLKLDWNQNLNYAVKMFSNGTQESFYVSVLINAGHFNPDQEKSTKFQWIDAEGDYIGEKFTLNSTNANSRGIDMNGTYFWVTDQADDYVYLYSEDGTDTGDMNFATSVHPVAITSNGSHSWIADYDEKKVYQYWTNGTAITNWVTTGETADRLVGVTTNNANIWVVTEGNEVYKYNMDGTYASETFDISGSGNTAPRDIVTDGSYFWISDYDDDYLYKYYMNGSWTTESTNLSVGGNMFIYGITMNDSSFFAVDVSASKVYEYNYDPLPKVFIDYPINNSNHTINTIDINYTTYGTEPATCWYSNDTMVKNTTITCGVNITSIIWTEQQHNVTVWVEDSSSNLNSSSVTFGIDTSIPAIDVTYPIANVDYQLVDTNMTVNWTVSDANLASCWLEYNGTNISIPSCLDNNLSINITSYEDRNFTFYANDTLGQENSSFVSWDYYVFGNSETYNKETVEGGTETFEINITYDNVNFNNIQTFLDYNGTVYLGTKTGTGNTVLYTRDVEIGGVAANVNVTFYWQIGLWNNTWNYYNSTSHNQSITNLAIDDCDTYNILLLNFSLKDEKLQTDIVAATYNTSVGIDVDIFPTGSSTAIIEYSQNYSENNNPQVCLDKDLSNSTYEMDVEVKYGGDSYAEESYHIQKYILTNDSLPLTINLLDLLDSEGQTFKIIFKDQYFLVVDGAIIQIQRKYTDEGLFKTVEIPKTDSTGRAVASLVIDEILYTFIISKNGVNLATFSEVKAYCQNPSLETCEISLNAGGSVLEPTDFTVLDDFSFVMEYNKSTRTITSVFNIPSGASSTMLLNATLYDNLGNTTACTDSLTSSSGTLTCAVPIALGNGTVIVNLYKGTELMGQGVISLDQDPKDLYGDNIVFLGLFLMMTLIGIGLGNSPMMTGFFVILGAIIAIALNLVDTGVSSFIGYGATILWLIVAIMIVIIKGAKRT